MNHRRAALAALPALLLVLVAAAGPVHHYRVDPAQSSVSARVAFFGIASKTARFPSMSGGIALAPDRPNDINLDISLDARQLTAGDSLTISRLRGPDFFDVEQYPTIRFVGTRLAMRNAVQGEVSGNLTARGVTRPATLSVTFARPPAEAAGTQPIALTGQTTIDRRDFGMTAYSLIVGRKVTITVRARMVPG